MKLPEHWIKPLARAGYFARGTVYVIIGLFALLAAVGSADSKDGKGALEALLEQPFGSVIVWLLIVGLAGYVIWRVIQSVFDTDRHGIGPRGLAIRGGLLASAITYATLAVFALSLLGVFSGGRNGGSGGIAGWLTGFFATNGWGRRTPGSRSRAFSLASPALISGKHGPGNMRITSKPTVR